MKAVEDDVAHDQVIAWYAGAVAELDAVVDEPTDVLGGLYDNALFENGPGHGARVPADSTTAAVRARPPGHPSGRRDGCRHAPSATMTTST
ncbi:hypothetical protein [Mumia zhuanghuii]|uniref:hypothetical protein n=1 Tax=Mumia zhuanghuii TaxID=2585211 RepID=UPI001E5E8504|nr:hypothetical protein [Mumia zhuanghuii]